MSRSALLKFQLTLVSPPAGDLKPWAGRMESRRNHLASIKRNMENSPEIRFINLNQLMLPFYVAFFPPPPPTHTNTHTHLIHLQVNVLTDGSSLTFLENIFNHNPLLGIIARRKFWHDWAASANITDVFYLSVRFIRDHPFDSTPSHTPPHPYTLLMWRSETWSS